MAAPEDCMTKEQVRAEIDRLDRQIVGLLGERFSYVRRMAQLKQAPDEANDPARVGAVLDKIAAEASAIGLDADLARSLWRRLIDWNIAWERAHIGSGDDD